MSAAPHPNPAPVSLGLASEEPSELAPGALGWGWGASTAKAEPACMGGETLGPSPGTLSLSGKTDLIVLWLCQALPHEAPLSHSPMKPSPCPVKRYSSTHCTDAELEGQRPRPWVGLLELGP